MPRKKVSERPGAKGAGDSKSRHTSGTSKPGGGSVASGGQSTRAPSFGKDPSEPRPSKRAGKSGGAPKPAEEEEE